MERIDRLFRVLKGRVPQVVFLKAYTYRRLLTARNHET